jgi:hypothetical protein
MSELANLYFGAAGQLAVMSEFLILGYNVAIPEVDRGDDLFVVKDQDGEFRKIQIKSANAKSRVKSNDYSCMFKVKLDQLSTPQTPELFYVFIVRHQDRWSDILCISRSDLHAKHVDPLIDIGKIWGKNVSIEIKFKNRDIFYRKIKLNQYRGIDSVQWPKIQP